METLLSTILYLWLVLTFLLVVMWTLRDQDRRRESQREKAIQEELLAAAAVPDSSASDAVDKGTIDDESDDEAEPETKPHPTIEELLDGITLPHDLTPLTAGIENREQHAIFISSHPDAAAVGTAFADELVEQGYAIEPAGFDQALATRGDQLLSMRISPKAGDVKDGSNPRYPGVDDTDVAIEVWVGNGSPPPLTG